MPRAFNSLVIDQGKRDGYFEISSTDTCMYVGAKGRPDQDFGG